MQDILKLVLIAAYNWILFLYLNKEYREHVYTSIIGYSDAILKDIVLHGDNYLYPVEATMTIEEQIHFSGYQYEEHETVSEDGYILKMFRIPGLLRETYRHKEPVLMVHGLLDHGGTWVNNNPQMTLGYQLVNEGYDVWLANNRGTIISNQHQDLTADDPEYWNFTIHEMAKYDIEAFTSYILSYTEQEQLIYVGYSQGTTQWFLANAYDPSLSKYFKAFIGLAPVFFITDIQPMVTWELDYINFAKMVSKSDSYMYYTERQMETGQVVTHYLPNTIYFMGQQLCGHNKQIHVDLSRLPLHFSNIGGTSSKNILQWYQWQQQEVPRQFDYGSVQMNMQIYGSEQPPQYDISSLKTNLKEVKMQMFIGGIDEIATIENFNRIKESLPDDNTEIVIIDDYNHIDFIWANDAHSLVHQKVIRFLDQIQ